MKQKWWRILSILGLLIILGGGWLMWNLGTTNIKNMEPRIVVLTEPIQAVGLGTKTSIKTVFRDIPALGKQYKKLKGRGIPNRKEPWSFLAVSRDYNAKTQEWEYLMGDVVTGLNGTPSELAPFAVPAGTYAVFPIRPKNKFLWGLVISKTKQYAYDRWLPESPYEQAGIDFEYHDARSLAKQPEIELYIAVNQK